MLPVLRLLINTSWADRGIHHPPGIPPSLLFPSLLPLPLLAYKLAGVVGVNQRGIMSQHPQQEVHLMKSFVIYVWGRIGGKNLGPTHSGFQELGPLEQKEKGDRKQGSRPRLPAPCQRCTAHKSHMANQTKPLTHTASLEVVSRTILWALFPLSFPSCLPSSVSPSYSCSTLLYEAHRPPHGHQACPAAPLFWTHVFLCDVHVHTGTSADV